MLQSSCLKNAHTIQKARGLQCADQHTVRNRCRYSTKTRRSRADLRSALVLLQLQLPPRRAAQHDFKKRTISRAEGGQLQALVSRRSPYQDLNSSYFASGDCNGESAIPCRASSSFTILSSESLA